MARRPVFLIFKLGGLAPAIGISVLSLAGGVFSLLAHTHDRHVAPGPPLWLLGIGLLLFSVYLFISIIKTILIRRRNPEMKKWTNPSA